MKPDPILCCVCLTNIDPHENYEEDAYGDFYCDKCAYELEDCGQLLE